MEPPPPSGLLLLGGQTAEEPLTSIETFGFANCSIPPLPETRYGFGSFIAPTQPPQLAVCGGWWMGKPISTDCLTLNVTSGQWERGTFINGTLGDGVRGVINMDGEGVFLIHSIGMSVLAPGADSWVAGPMFITEAECGCNLSTTSLATIHMSEAHNVREYSVSNGKAEPKPVGSWPSLLTKRRGSGCGATSLHLVVAGGVSEWDEVLNSVEVIHIVSKALRRGGDMQQARAYFQIIPVGSMHPRLLAVGGKNASSIVDTSEWWEEEENVWQAGPMLATGRSNFAALMAPPHLVCLDMDQPEHSCPVAHNTSQTCVFPTVESGVLLIKIMPFGRHQPLQQPFSYSPLMLETNYTLGPILKTRHLVLFLCISLYPSVIFGQPRSRGL